MSALLFGLAACVVDEPSTTAASRGRPGPPPPEVSDWLAEHQLPLTGVAAGAGLTDLAPLAAHLGGARVIGLGEATHGSREFFQLKHRLIEYLVTERGVRTIGFEGGLPEALDVDAYIQTGQGDAARAVAGLGYWPWMTDEVVELVEWLRRWNQVHPHDPVAFRGFDMQVPDRAVREVLAYLGELDATVHARFAASLAMARSRYDFFRVTPTAMLTLRAEADALIAHLDANAADYRARTTPARFALMRQLAVVAGQCFAMTYADLTGGEWDGSNLRDAAMADNVEWWLAQSGPTGRLALWAHNFHVAKDYVIRDYVPMGEHLGARLGADYHSVGFGFDRGGFQAQNASFAVQAFTVTSGGADTLDGALADAVAPVALVPLAEVSDPVVARWFAARPLKRDVTAGYLPELADAYFRETAVRDFYDTVAWVAEVTPAQLTRYARDQVAPQPIAPAAINLDLEAVDGDQPSGWFAPISNEVGGYRVASTTALPYAGARSARLYRDNQAGYGRDYGELRQRVSAIPYRGRRVRVRAHVRASTGPGARVHLFARAGASYDGMHDRPITTSDWTTYDLFVDVGATATNLSFGLVVVGDGAAWLDEVSLTPVP